jgi:chromate transporter
VVGVVLNLAVWFALHTLFGEVRELRGPVGRLLVPVPSTLDAGALVIAAAASWALLRARLGLLPVLLGAVLAGIAWHALR